MKPEEVVARVTDTEIWENSVWVNEENKLFFIPIWRCGNTTFMHDIAGPLEFTLEKKTDLSDYQGIAFIRNPLIRLPSQLWIAHKNTNISIPVLIDSLNNDTAIDEHLRKQVDFLKPYKVNYFIDLDNYQAYVTKNKIITKILEILSEKKHFSAVKKEKDKIIECLLEDNYHNIIAEYTSDDMDLFNKKANTFRYASD